MELDLRYNWESVGVSEKYTAVVLDKGCETFLSHNNGFFPIRKWAQPRNIFPVGGAYDAI